MKKIRLPKNYFVIVCAVMTALAVFILGGPVHSAEKEVRLAVTDIEGLEMLQREFGAFKDLLSQYSGSKINFFQVPNRTAAVEAVKSKKVDMILTGPAE